MPPVEANRYPAWAEAGVENRSLARDDALAICHGEDLELLKLVDAAGTVRRHFFGRQVTIHVLDNVRNGACPEDCGYCGQSRDSDAPIRPYKLKAVSDIVAEAARAQAGGAYRYCMALSGRGPSDRDVDHVCDAIRQIKGMGLRTCLSAGLLDQAKARQLKEAGLDRFNHNLNTSSRHYPAICTTHTYDDRLQTLRAARKAGLGLCSGLIVGMDEQIEDVVDTAFALREVGAESVPVNFLLPIDGNRVNQPTCGGRPLTPQFVLRVLCMVRLVNPDAEIRIAAGREVHLRSLQALALHPANSLFAEGYLLTEGQAADQTLQMILDAGFEPVFEKPELVPASLKQSAIRAGAGLPLDDRGDAAVPETTLKLTVRARDLAGDRQS
ncbi:MAG: biotin synthase BioB [Phycisphaerae bacterium]|nr:biotin synthase BioB [Phycisphaerae bacterium]